MNRDFGELAKGFWRIYRLSESESLEDRHLAEELHERPDDPFDEIFEIIGHQDDATIRMIAALFEPAAGDDEYIFLGAWALNAIFDEHPHFFLESLLPSIIGTPGLIRAISTIMTNPEDDPESAEALERIISENQ